MSDNKALMPSHRNKGSTASIIEYIYRIVLSPSAMEDFFEHWETYIEEHFIENELPGAGGAAPMQKKEDIERHFAIGLRLLEELEQKPYSQQDKPVENFPALSTMLLDQAGRIVWFNGAAFRHFKPSKGANCSKLPLVNGSQGLLSTQLAKLRTNTRPSGKPVLLHLSSRVTDKPVFMLTSFIDNYDNEQLLQLKQSSFVWEQALDPIIVRSFKLSDGELEIVKLFCEGTSINGIAKLRNSSVNTVRTQIKTIMSKTGAGCQLELLRLILTLNGLVGSNAQTSRANDGFYSSYFESEDKRRIPFHEYGPKDGKPFLFIHGMLDGHDVTKEARHHLSAHNIRLIAIDRPGFGKADLDDGPEATAPERFAKDAEALLDYLKIDQIEVIGHMSGSVFAFATAALLKHRITRVFSISGGVPIISISQLSQNPPRQKFFAYMARFMPQLMSFITKAGVQEVRTGGEAGIMKSLHSNCAQDLELTQVPEVFEIVRQGYHFATQQGPRAFEIDAYHVVRDWGKYVDQSIAPFHLIHGRHDPTVRLADVEKFARRYPHRATLTIDDISGQLMYYGNPSLIVQTLSNMKLGEQVQRESEHVY